MADRAKRRSDLLDTAQAAEFVGLQPETLSKWRWQRKGPNYLRAGRLVFYRLADLEEWQQSQLVDCALPVIG